MEVDQTGKGDKPVHIDDRRAVAAEPRADLGDRSVGDEDVCGTGALELRSAEEKDLGHRASPLSSVAPASSR